MDRDPIDPVGTELRVRKSFGQQRVMTLLGATLSLVGDGRAEITLPCRADLGQQNGFVHAGVSTTIADSAGGYAALSLCRPGEDVLTSEFKMNFLAPAKGESLLARGRVLKAGGKLFVCQVEVFAREGGRETQCVAGLMTVVRMLPSSKAKPAD